LIVYCFFLFGGVNVTSYVILLILYSRLFGTSHDNARWTVWTSLLTCKKMCGVDWIFELINLFCLVPITCSSHRSMTRWGGSHSPHKFKLQKKSLYIFNIKWKDKYSMTILNKRYNYFILIKYEYFMD